MKASRSNIWFPLLWFILFLTVPPSFSHPNPDDSYQAVPGLIDLRSTFSDGAHKIEELVLLSRARGFRVLFINDHDRIALSYGVPPFRNILRYKKEFPSIMTHGPEKFLKEIERISRKYPDTIIIPGCETSAYYYWTGSPLTKDLTAHEYDRRILIFNFNSADDYKLIPNLHNSLSLKYTTRLLPASAIFLVPLLIGIILSGSRRPSRGVGLLFILLSTLALIDYNPFRSSPFSAFRGNQGIAPFQEVIDYANSREGLSFWNYMEQRSGLRRHGPINVITPPYPQVLYQSKGYTGFAAIYGDMIKATEPGLEWDRVLNEFSRGQRNTPPWGISTADFHEEGRLGLKLGAFPTTFLVKNFSRAAILEAMRKGRMFCSQGDGRVWPRFDYFNITGKEGEKVSMGETLKTPSLPIIKFRVSYNEETSRPIVILLVRGGVLIHTFKAETPLEIEYLDRDAPSGVKTYYRLMDSSKTLISNPIFVEYHSASRP